MFRLICVFLILIVASGTASAQTDTPTPTETPTPELAVMFTMPAPDVEGTPQPGQDVVIIHSIDLDQIALALLEFSILVLLWVSFFIARARRWI